MSVHGDLPLFHQVTGAALERFFAHPSKLPDLFGFTVVIHRQRISVFTQDLQQPLGRFFNFVVPLALQGEVNPIVVGNANDVSFHSIADRYGLENLVAVDHTPMPVVDHDAESDRSLGGYQDIDFLARGYRQLDVVDKSFQVSRRNDASGNVVRIEVDRILFPDIQARRLIPVGQE